MRRKYYEFGPVVKEEMSFKDFFLSGALAALFSAEPKHLCNFGRGLQEEQFCEVILNLNQLLRRCHLKDF